MHIYRWHGMVGKAARIIFPGVHAHNQSFNKVHENFNNMAASAFVWYALRWRHNGHDGVSNHQPHHCLLNRLFQCRSKKASKLRVTGLCAANSPGTGEFPAQMVSNAENVSIWCCHRGRGDHSLRINLNSSICLLLCHLVSYAFNCA